MEEREVDVALEVGGEPGFEGGGVGFVCSLVGWLLEMDAVDIGGVGRDLPDFRLR